MKGTSYPFFDEMNNYGTHDFRDLEFTDIIYGGIYVGSPYTIMLELNCEHEFDKIQVRGVIGYDGFWPPSGANAKILTSKDKTEWTVVGSLPSNFGQQILTVSLKKTIAKFIKFQHYEELGLGYLKINKIR